jgi:CheY-like chemotaxis protein
MSVSGEDLNRQINEFVAISNQVLIGMNEILSGAIKEIQVAISHVDEVGIENNKNFNELKQETQKFKIITGKERKTILLIDDDATHLAATEAMLEGGYNIVTAKSGHEALSLFYQGLVPNLILLDLIMPDMDGWATYDRMKAIGDLHSVPIAFFTSSDDAENRGRAKQMEAIDYILKPVKKSELLERVGGLVKR